MAPTDATPHARRAGATLALRAGIAAGIVAGGLGAIAAALLVLLPPGVLVQEGSGRIALALFQASMIGTVAVLAGVALGAALALAGDPAPLCSAIAVALVGLVMAPATLVLNVRHLPALRTWPSLLGNAALLAAALVVVLSIRRLLRSRLPAGGAPRSLVLAIAAAALVLPGAVAAWRFDARGSTAADGEGPWARIAGSQTRRTLVLVTIDALRADHLGCYGYARATSPVIDRLAAEGTLYERAFAQAPNTHPSLASMLTGTPLVAFDELATLDFLPQGAEPLAMEMKRRGYRTGAVVSNPYLGRKMGFGQGFERYDDTSAMVGAAPAVTTAALRLASELEGPLFLWVHYLDPHHPYRPPPPYDTRFGPAVPKVDAMQALPDLSERLIAAGKGELPLSPEEWARLETLYDGEIRLADDELGRLIDGLRAAGRLEDARLVVTADHGEEFRDHGGVLHAHSLYRELVHLPLIVWETTPGSGTPPAGGRRDARLLAATSVGELLLGSVPEPADVVLSEKLEESPGLSPPLVSVRSADCTLIVPAFRPDPFLVERRRLTSALRSLALFAPVAARRQLYCEGDAGERHDVAGERPEDVRALTAKLGEVYRARGMRFGGSALPDERTQEQLKGLGYFR